MVKLYAPRERAQELCLPPGEARRYIELYTYGICPDCGAVIDDNEMSQVSHAKICPSPLEKRL